MEGGVRPFFFPLTVLLAYLRECTPSRAVDIARIAGDSSQRVLGRQEHRELCDHWTGRLAQEGVDGYSPAEAWDDYRLSYALILVIAAVVATLDEPGKREAETLYLFTERILGSALELDTAAFVAAFR